MFISDELYTITHPVLIKSHYGNIEHQLHIQASEFDRNFTIPLIQNPHVVSKDFVVLQTFSNGSSPIFLKDEDYLCYFRGEKSAISLCNGMVSSLTFPRYYNN